MKKMGWLLLLMFVVGIAASSCRTQKQACAAYSSVEPVQKNDSNS